MKKLKLLFWVVSNSNLIDIIYKIYKFSKDGKISGKEWEEISKGLKKLGKIGG